MEIKIFDVPIKSKKNILALGPESAGNFSLYSREKIYVSQNFGDLLDEENFKNFKGAVNKFLRTSGFRPDIILTDLHPLYKTTILGEQMIIKSKGKHVKVQHHVAHVFSSAGEKKWLLGSGNGELKLRAEIIGVACDGTGFGLDGKIWGGEVLKIVIGKEISRIGHLENQILIGGDLAVKEPARMLISILSKFLDKKAVYNFMKKYYSRNHFEVLCNQLRSRFNCQETSSTARVLDAVAVLLGFSKNIRNKKHGPVIALEKNSTRPYQLKPKIVYDSDRGSYVILTAPLFEFLFKNFDRDKKRLAATAQLYLAQGLYEIAKKHEETGKYDYFFSGGMADNKIMSDYFSLNEFYLSKKIPRGDAGISFGQIVYYLSGANKSWE